MRHPIGEAWIAPDFKLYAKFVVYTVGLDYRDGLYSEPMKFVG